VPACAWLAAVVWQTCATIEHFAAFAPAFGRRPYILESNLSLVVKTDYSLAGVALRLSTVIAGVPLAGEIVPNSAGHAKLEFPLSLLPRANFSETVNITLTLPDGRSKSKPRRFMRCAAGKKRLFWSHFYILQTIILPRQARDKHRASTQKERVVFSYRALAPAAGMPTSTEQVDHESGGLLMDGVRKTCNGWFNNPNGGIAGQPASDTCDIARTNELRTQTLLAAKNQAAQVAQQGMHGLTFLRDAIMTECTCIYTYNCICMRKAHLFAAPLL